jgi:hypothetical protein
MTETVTDSDEIVLLRHIPGGTHYQGKPPLRITSENFRLRIDTDTRGLEEGISASKTTLENLLLHARRVLDLRRTGSDSRIGYAYKQAIESAGFVVHGDPTADDEAHCLIKSASTHLEDHAGRKKLASTFNWVQIPDLEPGSSPQPQ